MGRDGEQQQESTRCRSFLDPNKGSVARLGSRAVRKEGYIWAIEQARASV